MAERDAHTVMTVHEPTIAERHEAVDIALLGLFSDDLSAAHLVDRQNVRAAEQLVGAGH